MTNSIFATPLTYGQGAGQILKLDEPVSFWGGIDHLGMISDVHHPQHGEFVTGRILAMTSGRGSSSGAYCLMELMRLDLAPAAIVLCEPDGIISLGVLAAQETYGSTLPIIEISLADFDALVDGCGAAVISEADNAQLAVKPGKFDSLANFFDELGKWAPF